MAKRVRDVELLISKKLRQLRTQKEMTLEELGNVVGTSAQQIQKYESGQNRISSGVLLEIANALQTPIHIFYEGHIDAPMYSSTTQTTALILNEEYSEYNEEAVELSAEEINTLFRFFSQIKDQTVRQSLIRIAKELAGKDSSDQ